jgi:thioredoxin-dependent peroxiredoxin
MEPAMHGRFGQLSATLLAACAMAATAGAQTPTAAPVAPPWVAPDVGSIAPDFSLTGATRYGVRGTPVRLSDYRGKTVVLAFFYKARTKG